MMYDLGEMYQTIDAPHSVYCAMQHNVNYTLMTKSLSVQG